MNVTDPLQIRLLSIVNTETCAVPLWLLLCGSLAFDDYFVMARWQSTLLFRKEKAVLEAKMRRRVKLDTNKYTPWLPGYPTLSYLSGDFPRSKRRLLSARNKQERLATTAVLWLAPGGWKKKREKREKKARSVLFLDYVRLQEKKKRKFGQSGETRIETWLVTNTISTF